MLFKQYELNFIFALFLTLLIEGIVVYLLLNRFPVKTKIELKKLIRTIVIVNAVTLPFVWFVFPALISNYLLFISIAELFAFIAEALLYSHLLKLNIREALKISFAANLASFLIGFVFF